MTARLAFDPFLKRKIRVEDWEGQGASTLSELRAALFRENTGQALELLDLYVWESVWLYRGYLAWLRDWVEAIGAREGPGLWRYLERARDHGRHFGLDTLPIEIAEAAAGALHSIRLGENPPSLLNDAGGAIALAAWIEVGVDELRSLEEAIAGGDWGSAPERLEWLHRVHKPYHDIWSDLLWLWMTMLAESWGEDEMIELIADSGKRLRTAGLASLPMVPLETQVRHMAAAMRGHRSGTGEEGDIQVTEDDEKYVISFDACGSGGRMRRRGEIDGLPPRQDAPFNFGVTRKPHDMSWGKTGVPYYCLHCAAYAEMQSTDQLGYPSRVTLFDPDPTRPCAWAFYKNPARIPDRFFTRIGRRRPRGPGQADD